LVPNVEREREREREREEHRLRVFENSVLRRIFGPKREGENYTMMNFITCILHLILLG
jgi:hypothetical protein